MLKIISEDDDEASDLRKRRKSPKGGNNYNKNSHQINGNDELSSLKPTIASSQWAGAGNSSLEEPELKKARVSTERSRSSNMSLTPEVTNRHRKGSKSSSQNSEQTEKLESTSQKEEKSPSHSYGSERGEDSDYSSQKIQESSPNEFSDYDEEIEEKKETPDVPMARRYDMLKGCRNVDEFKKLNKINEGTYEIVYKARDKKLGSDVDKIFMVMEYMEHGFKGFMEHCKREKFRISEVKCLMLQLLEGVGYLLDNWVLH